MVDGGRAQGDPVVTVIIATYNQSNSLRLALESVLNQDFSAFEVWVVGDGCTDDSATVVRSFFDDRLHWMNLERNCGSQAGPNNAGLRVARGRYVAYLGHDDLWLPWHLSSLVARIEETNADVAHSLCALVAPGGIVGCAGAPGEGDTYAHHFVRPSSWLHRRDLITDCGMWRHPAGLAWDPDFDYLRRAYLAGKSIVCCSRVTILKFPSPWFRSYANVDTPPQQLYAGHLKDPPGKLEHQVLHDLAVALTRYRHAPTDPSFRHAGGVFLRALLRAIRRCPRPLNLLEIGLLALPRDIGYRFLDTYERAGHDRWPMSAYVYWKFQQQRRAARLKRGLPPAKSTRRSQA